MKLYLIQHGISLPEDKDPKKPLSPQGKDETQKIAEFLKGKNIKVDSIWQSKKLRSIQTARIISETISDAEMVERDDLNPLDPVDKIASELEVLDKDILIVGHLPFLSKLASQLLTAKEDSDIISFKNSGVVCLEYKEGWKLNWIVTPELA